MTRRGAQLGVSVSLLFWAETALAYDAAVDATLNAQLYQVTSPYGDPIVRRRRYTETFMLRVNDLQGPHEPGAPQLDAVARLRLDADLGQDPAERDPTREDRFVPGLAQAPLDLMMAYVEGRNYLHGLAGFRLGRQYLIDPLGFWSFDGGLVRLDTEAHIAVEAYGGFEQRGGLPMLSTSRFEADGVYRGDRRGMGQELWPSYLKESRLAPAWGVTAESTGLDWLDTKVTYRRVVNRDAVVVSPYADAAGNFATYTDDRVSSERLGWSGNAVLSSVGALRGNFVYDLYRTKPTQYGGAADVHVTRTVSAGADLDYFLPTFDGDSIFNWFSHGGTTTFTGRARWDATRRLTVSGTAGGRRFATEGDGGSKTDFLASADAMFRYPEGTASLRVMDEEGTRGHVRGADLSTLRRFEGGLYEANALVSIYGWDDASRPDRATKSFLYVVGGGYRPFERTRVGVEWEHAMNDLVGHRFRALATLAVTVY